MAVFKRNENQIEAVEYGDERAFGERWLADIVEWIGSNLNPRQVFTLAVLADTVLETDWIESNFDPQDIFDKEALANWAEGNGYVKKEEES